MGVVSVTLPADGTSADVSDYNTPINTLVSEFNGNIDNANIKSGAAISGSKLADSSLDIGVKASNWDGWVAITDSWTFASATTVNVPSDATTKFEVGDKIKFSQSGTKYFYVTAVAATVLTLTGGSDYSIANAAISGIYYSKASTPQGFPGVFNWTPTWTNLTAGNGTVIYAAFRMLGKTVNWRLQWAFGNTTSVSGLIGFSLPVTANAALNDGNDSTLTTGQYSDATGNRWNPAVLPGSTSRFDLYYWNSSANIANTGGSAPFAWAVSDVIALTGSYEAA